MKPVNYTKPIVSLIVMFAFLLNCNFQTLSAKEIYGKPFQPSSIPASYESFIANVYLLNSDGTTHFADGTLAQFNNAWSPLVDFMDGIKFGNINEQLSLLRTSTALALERRPIINAPDTMFLKLTKTTQRDYRMQVITTNLDHPGMQGEIQDSYTGVPIPLDLNGSTTFDFTIDANPLSSASNRFMAVFRPTVILPVTFKSIVAIRQGIKIDVRWKVDNELNISNYVVERSFDGRNFTIVGTVLPAASSNGGSNVYDWYDLQPSKGDNFYRIRSVGASGDKAYSTIAKAAATGIAPSLLVFPNPISSDRIGLQMNNMDKGEYQVKLYNVYGQLIQKNTIVHDIESNTEIIPLQQSLPRGIYQLEVVNPDYTKQSLQLLY